MFALFLSVDSKPSILPIFSGVYIWYGVPTHKTLNFSILLPREIVSPSEESTYCLDKQKKLGVIFFPPFLRFLFMGDGDRLFICIYGVCWGGGLIIE